MQVYPERGIARFQRQPPSSTTATGTTLGGAAIGALVGTAMGAATDTKEGLLGGLLLGMLVGGAVGAAAAPVERVLALQFDASTSERRLYGGPLLRWAKDAIRPPEAA